MLANTLHPFVVCLQKFGRERTETQALLGEQLLRVAELQAGNAELDRAHTSTLQVCTNPEPTLTRTSNAVL